MRKLLAAGAALLLCALAATAQSGGLPPEWEVRKQLEALAENVQRFQPVLEKVDPRNWENAPASYADQVTRVRAEIGYLVRSTQALARQPDRLTVALDSYFRMQSVDAMLRSLEAGVRRHQNAAIADLMVDLLGRETADRERLRQYIVDLAADREQRSRVADEEAQRCRTLLSRQPQHASGRAAAKKEEPR